MLLCEYELINYNNVVRFYSIDQTEVWYKSDKETTSTVTYLSEVRAADDCEIKQCLPLFPSGLPGNPFKLNVRPIPVLQVYV